MEVYNTRQPRTTAEAERASTALDRRCIETLKSGVRIEQVAGDYGEFKLLGNGRLLGRCVSPAHEDRTPSMSIFTDTQRFKCFGIGCGAQGDVLDLVQLAEECELWEAMRVLSARYGVELPGRPPSWYAKQKRQRAARDAIDAVRVEHVRKLIFRLVFMPWLRQLPEWERWECAQSAWTESLPIARLLYAQRRDEEGVRA